MLAKLFVAIILVTIGFGSIHSQLQLFQGFPFWQASPEMLKTNEDKETLKGEFLPVSKRSVHIYEDDEESSGDMIHIYNPIGDLDNNRIKRQTAYFSKPSHKVSMESIEAKEHPNKISKYNDDVSMSDSFEYKKSSEDGATSFKQRIKKFQKFKAKKATLLKKPTVAVKMEKIKRQTSIAGSDNRVSNLLNLPVRLQLLANVLSKLNLGVMDPADSALATNNIVAQDNTVSSLVNAPINVDAILNILSKVDVTQPDAAPIPKATSPAPLADPLGGLLGGVLGGGGGDATNLGGGLLGGLLGNGGGGGLLGGLLDNGASDTLDGLLGGILGGVDGEDVVTDLLDELLDGVGELLEHLLALLLAILESLLKNLDGIESGPTTLRSNGTTQGGTNQVSSLINAPIKIKALINILSTVKQQIGQQVDPTAATQIPTIQGNDNVISSLINLPIDADLKLNLLSSVVQQISGGSSTAGTTSSGTVNSLIPNLTSLGGAGGTSINGDKNVISSLLNVAPDLKLNVNLLSQITEILGGGVETGNGGTSTGGIPGSNPNEICFDIPINQADNSIIGSGNSIFSLLNLSPDINLNLNLLSILEQAGGGNVPTQRVCIQKPMPATTPAPTTAAVTDPPNQICFNVFVDPSGNIVSGDNNQISSLVNVEPKLNLFLNLLSNIKQTAPQSNLTVKRICIPVPTVPTTTSKPVTATLPTAKPPVYPGEKRCYKRTCTKWKQFLDLQCLSKPEQYPKYTYTKDMKYTYTK